jgi:hypothetical protein
MILFSLARVEIKLSIFIIYLQTKLKLWMLTNNLLFTGMSVE